MRYFYLSLICLLCSSTYAQQDPFWPDRVQHASARVRHRYLDSLQHYVAPMKAGDAEAELHALQSRATANGDDRLAGEMVLLGVRWLPAQQVSELTESKIVEVEIKARSNKDTYLEAEALEALGDYWVGKKKPGPAFENYLAAHSLYAGFSPDEFPMKQEYLYALGGSYYHYDDIDNAIKYMKEALDIKISASVRENTIYNTIGLAYRKTGRYDSSEWYFRKVLDAAVAARDSAWTGIASGNIGITYFYEKRYTEAIPLLEKDIELSMATSNIRNAGRSMTILAHIYYLQHNYGRSEQLLKQALASMESKEWWPEYGMAEPIFTLLSKVYAAQNEINKAYLYADSAITAKDSVTSQNNVVSFAKAREKVDLVQHRLETEQIVTQKKMQELVRNGLIGAILLLTVIAVLLMNRQRLYQKKLEAEMRHAETELDHAAVQLQGFRQSMQEKNSIIEHFTTELERIKAGGMAEETETDVLTQLQNAIILTDEQWEHFRGLFEKVHKNFFVNLKKKIPDLSAAEIRFLALTKLKLSSKEMAAMLGISTNAIRLYRHRIRRKLDLDKEDMIEELVNNV